MNEARVDLDLEVFCQQEHSQLVGMLALYTGSRAICEELAQEAFIRLCRHWPRSESWLLLGRGCPG